MYSLEKLFMWVFILTTEYGTISFDAFITQLVALKGIPSDPLLAAAKRLFSYGGWDRSDRPDLFTFVSKYGSLSRKTYQGEQIFAVWKALWVLLKAPKVFANKDASVQYLVDVLSLLDSFYKLKDESYIQKREHRGTTNWKHKPLERKKRDGKVKNCLVYQ